MSQQIERFFHIRAGDKGGATIRVIGSHEFVTVQVARCSKKDNFCKKTGRLTAIKKPAKTIMLRHLPAELAGVAEDVAHGFVDSIIPYDFAVKYFLPK